MSLLTHVSTDPWLGTELGSGLGAPAAVGGQITAGSLLGAYRRGIFCQPRTDPGQIALNHTLYAPDVDAGDIPVLPGDGNPYATLWWSPPVRYVIPVDDVHLGRSSRRTLRGSVWTTSMDTDFDGVITACRGEREPRWITDELVNALRQLWEARWVRTIEVWNGSHLVGGLFGCALAGVFIMDSAFHTEPEAAKVAIADLGRRACAGNISLLDTQVRTEYTVRMGAREMHRAEYLRRLDVHGGQGQVEAGIGRAQDVLSSKSPVSESERA
jgi:leucyl/phenylalanyl-tRNA---protein transferase